MHVQVYVIVKKKFDNSSMSNIFATDRFFTIKGKADTFHSHLLNKEEYEVVPASIVDNKTLEYDMIMAEG